jgi:hypothetical protein
MHMVRQAWQSMPEGPKKAEITAYYNEANHARKARDMAGCEPWRHRSSLNPNAGISRMPADQNADLFWDRGALAPPESPASIVDGTSHRTILPGSRHYRYIKGQLRSSDVHI